MPRLSFSGMSVVAALGLCLVISPAIAGRFDAEALAAFEAYCLAPDPAARTKLLAAPGTTELPAKFAQPFLQPQSGKAYKIRRGAFDAVVMVTDQGVCGLFNTDSDGVQIVAKLRAKYKSRFFASQPSVDNETQDFYLLVYPPDKRFVVLSKRNPSKVGTLVHAVPSSVVKVPESEWPR